MNVYGLTVLIDAVRTNGMSKLFRHVVAVVPVLLALGWSIFNQVGEGAGSTLHFGFGGLARNGVRP